MSNGRITYDYDKILDGIEEMQTVNRAIEGLIESLAQQTGNALDNWTGPAASNYTELAKRIEQNFADLNTIVHQLATEIGVRADDMQTLDARSGNRFS